MYLKKVDLLFAVEKDLNEKDLDIVSVVHAQTPYDNIFECAVYLKDGRRVTSLFDGDVKLCDFTVIKSQEVK